MDKSGLYRWFAPTVYLLVTFAACPQPHHNYPTYSLNGNDAWQEPPATKVAVLKAIFYLQSSMATDYCAEFNGHRFMKGLHSSGHQGSLLA